MGIFKRSNNESVPITILDRNDFPDSFFGGYQKLYDNPNVSAGIDKISDLVSNMTITLWENSEIGDKRIKDGLSKKLDINPSKNMTRKPFIKLLVRTLIEEGNQVTLPEWNDLGYLDNLTPIRPCDLDFRTKGYDYDIKIGDTIFSYDEVLHFKLNPSPNNPLVGQGYKVHLKDVVENLEQAQRTKKGFMKADYLPSIVVRVDANSDQFQNREGRDKFKREWLGNNPGEPMIIPSNMMDVESIKPLTLKDIEINESVKIDKQTAAAILGIPAFLIGEGEFNQKEYNNFIETKILSIAKIIEQEMTSKLIFASNRYIKFNIKSLLSYSLKELAEVGVDMVSQGSMNRNEQRDWIGLSPIDGGDEFILLENYIDVKDTRKQKKLLKAEGGD